MIKSSHPHSIASAKAETMFANRKHISGSLSKSLALGGSMLALLISSASLAAPPASTAKPYTLPASDMPVAMQGSNVKVKTLDLPIGRSAIVDLPVEASDVFVSNPKVADAVLRTPRRIFIMGLEGGQSDAIFFDRAGRQILSLNIRVATPTNQLSDMIKRIYPNSNVEVQALNDRIILSGLVANNAEASAIGQMAGSFTTKPEGVINLLGVVGKSQVMVKVRIVEVNRTAIKQLGFKATNVFSGATGTNRYDYSQTPTYGVNQQIKGGSVLSRTTRDLTGSISAFERAGLVRTLAEPQITTSSGEAGKFLAGGEFPIPTGRDNQGNITIQFKPYGVALGIVPVVMSNGSISVKVSTEVSELSNEAALRLTDLTIPALIVRRTEDTVEMASGESIMLSGLLLSKSKQSIDSLPGLTTLPILGTLFRSRDFLNDQSELVVIMTTYLVKGTSSDMLQTPADNLHLADDMDAVFMGKLNRVIKEKKLKSGQASESQYENRRPLSGTHRLRDRIGPTMKQSQRYIPSSYAALVRLSGLAVITALSFGAGSALAWPKKKSTNPDSSVYTAVTPGSYYKPIVTQKRQHI